MNPPKDVPAETPAEESLPQDPMPEPKSKPRALGPSAAEWLVGASATKEVLIALSRQHGLAPLRS